MMQDASSPRIVSAATRRLVLAHVGEQRAAVHVADRIEPVAGAHRVVHLDRLAGLEAHALEARGPPCWDAGRWPRAAASTTRRRRRARAPPPPRRPWRARPPPSRRSAPPPRPRAAPPPPAGRRRAPRAAISRSAPSISVTCDAERAPGLSHLHADHAAAQDHQPLGQLLGRGDLAVGPVAAPRAGRRSAARARRCRWPPPPRGGPRASSSPACTRRSPSRRPRSRTTVDAAALEPGHHARVVEVVDDLVAALEHRGHVELAGHRLAHAGDAAHLGQQLARAQQRLRGHAGIEGALTARSGAAPRSPRRGRPRPGARHRPRRPGRRRR